jgi:hypothetical protein
MASNFPGAQGVGVYIMQLDRSQIIIPWFCGIQGPAIAPQCGLGAKHSGQGRQVRRHDLQQKQSGCPLGIS